MPDFIEVLPAQAQPRYRQCAHDSLQYHFFAGRHVFAARLFLTESLEHSSVWMYEDGVEELFSSSEDLGFLWSFGFFLEETFSEDFDPF